MASELDFFQIYFKEEQKTEIYDFATPYFNKTLTHAFENSVIEKLVPQTTAELVSVCSWRLRKKRGDMLRLPDKTLTKEKILNSDFDVAILTPRSPTHDVMGLATKWHGQAFTDAINDLRSFIKVPQKLKYAIYENHFICRGDIYKAYVNDCLSPVMHYCGTRDIYMVDSRYRKTKPAHEVEEYTKKTGRLDWPILPFVLERLFSVWINDKDFKVINL